MIELLAPVSGGFVTFFLLLLRYLPSSHRERTSGELFATFSAIVLIFFVLVATGVISADLGESQRVAAFYTGAASAYLLSRFAPRRTRRSLPSPLMSPEYDEASRRIDEIFDAMRAERRR